MTWQPIATAPMDGTRILAYGPGTDRFSFDIDEKLSPLVAAVHWHVVEYEDYEDAGNGLFREVKKQSGGHWSPYSAGFFRPTHWMSLPPPPEK